MKGFKTCTKCKTEKNSSQFYADRTRRDGLSYSCRSCRKKGRDNNSEKNIEYQRKRRFSGGHLMNEYGITLDEFEDMQNKQDHKCKICYTHKSDTPKGKLYIDHCHKTNKVRALLCQHCNSMIGFAKDNTKTLMAGIAYIRKYSKAST